MEVRLLKYSLITKHHVIEILRQQKKYSIESFLRMGGVGVEELAAVRKRLLE